MSNSWDLKIEQPLTLFLHHFLYVQVSWQDLAQSYLLIFSLRSRLVSLGVTGLSDASQHSTVHSIIHFLIIWHILSVLLRFHEVFRDSWWSSMSLPEFESFWLHLPEVDRLIDVIFFGLYAQRGFWSYCSSAWDEIAFLVSKLELWLERKLAHIFELCRCHACRLLTCHTLQTFVLFSGRYIFLNWLIWDWRQSVHFAWYDLSCSDFKTSVLAITRVKLGHSALFDRVHLFRNRIEMVIHVGASIWNALHLATKALWWALEIKSWNFCHSWERTATTTSFVYNQVSLVSIDSNCWHGSHLISVLIDQLHLILQVWFSLIFGFESLIMLF